MDAKIQEAFKLAADTRDPILEQKAIEAQKVLTPLKDMYKGHRLRTGDKSFETTNGVIQGAVNSPNLFAIYQEYFLF